MRKALENQTLEERPVEFKATTLFNGQVVVVDFRTQLPVNSQASANSLLKVTIDSHHRNSRGLKLPYVDSFPLHKLTMADGWVFPSLTISKASTRPGLVPALRQEP
jgi:hypothetical protein